MRPHILVLASLFAFLAISIPLVESRRSLKECGSYGCYEEDKTRGLAEFVDHIDKNYIRDAEFEKKAMIELRENVTFNLYGFPSHPNISESIKVSDKPEFFHKNYPTKIIIHGWQNDEMSPIGQSTKDAFLKMTQKHNVFIVDWSNGSKRMYNRARACVPLVAEIVAEFIDRLVQYRKLDVKTLHIIGHSLGAHVAGLAGTRIKAGRPARVTGLDPAKPTFDPTQERISKESADYVDIIHSCGNRLGLSEPVGHVDYYPNRGEALQRGCLTDYDASCSHSRSIEIFAESLLDPKAFKAVLCKDWETFRTSGCAGNPTIYIGEEIPTGYQEGLYFLKTGKNPPLGLGDDSIIYTAEDIIEDNEDSRLAQMLFSIL